MLFLGMFQDVIHSLSQIGLKDKDAQIYLLCLHHKAGLYVHEIVKETGIHRSTVDLALSRLVADGYINKVKVGPRYKYIAESADTVFAQKEQALGHFKELLPMLSKLGANKGETEVKFFEGRKGLEAMYADSLAQTKFAEGEKRHVFAFAHGAQTFKAFPEVQSRYIDKRVKAGVWYYCIAPQSSLQSAPTFTNDEKALREVKGVPDENFPFKVTMETYADSVMIFSPIKPYGGVVIRNAPIADSMRALHKLVWGLV